MRIPKLVSSKVSSLLGEQAGGGAAATDAVQLIASLERVNDELASANRALEHRVHSLERLVFIDPLTGLGNRRYFDAQLGPELRRALRSRRPLALLLCNIDRFGYFNRRHGREAGDALLVDVARALRRACRRGGDRPLRYGGDEFALLLPDTDGHAAAAFAAQLQREVAAIAGSSDHGSVTGETPTVSIGAGIYSAAALCTPNLLIAAARDALARAQAGGGDRTELISCPA